MELGLGDLGDRHPVLVDRPADPVEQALHRIDPGRHFGQLVADHLVLDQVFAEGPALPGVGHAFVEADLHHAQRLGDQADALQVEILHDGDEAAVLLAQQVFRRHPAFVEIERRLVGAPPAHLAVERRAAEILRIGLDEEQRYAGQPLAAGARRDDEIVARHAAGDEGLAALDDVMVAVLPGPGLQVGDVRTAARFGDAE